MILIFELLKGPFDMALAALRQDHLLIRPAMAVGDQQAFPENRCLQLLAYRFINPGVQAFRALAREIIRDVQDLLQIGPVNSRSRRRCAAARVRGPLRGLANGACQVASSISRLLSCCCNPRR